MVLYPFMLSVEANDGQRLSHYELVIVNVLCHRIMLHKVTQTFAGSAKTGLSTQLIPNHPI